MELIGPERYRLDCTATKFTLSSAAGGTNFSRRLCVKGPKLYVVADRGAVVYVGITNQPLRARLYLGWTAKGANGYRGYSLRHHLKRADLFVWLHPRHGRAHIRELKTIEAEVAYHVRRRKQWPKYQTEIHFYPSTAAHRRIARKIVDKVAQAR